MRIVNLLWLLLLSAPCTAPAAPVEVIANGVPYDSIDAYRASKVPVKAASGTGPAMSKQEGGTAKTIVLAPPAISAPTEHVWRRLSFESGVKKVIVDFQQDWNNPVARFHIAPAELEDRLKALIDGRKKAVMVVSRSNKLRVMELDKKNAPQ